MEERKKDEADQAVAVALHPDGALTAERGGVEQESGIILFHICGVVGSSLTLGGFECNVLYYGSRGSMGSRLEARCGRRAGNLRHGLQRRDDFGGRNL